MFADSSAGLADAATGS